MTTTDQSRLRQWSNGVVSPSISDAIAELNRLGHFVDDLGTITVDGERVQLKVQGGALVAVVGGATIPWTLFRRALRPKRITAA
jgi:hypothetical protein